jgi:hypothetical protein
MQSLTQNNCEKGMLASPCTFVRLSGSMESAPTGQIFLKIYSGDLAKIFRENSSLVKI